MEMHRCVHTHTHLPKHTNKAHSLFHVTAVGLITLSHYTLSIHTISLLTCSLPPFYSFQVFTAHLIPELFWGLIVSDAYNFTLPPHSPPSSHLHLLSLSFFSPFHFQLLNCHHQACRGENITHATRRTHIRVLHMT